MTSALDVVTEFGRRWAAHDLPGTLALIADDCVFDSTGPAPDGERCEGRAAISAAWNPIFDNTASVFEVEETIVADDRVVQLWTYSWGDGHVRGIDVFRVAGGLVVEKFSYVKG
ncbi:MAG: nuclear transport factor 2 family protein [Acidimicrobiia bacterium]